MLIVAMFRTINEKKNDSYYSEKMSWQSLMKLKQRIMLVFTKIFLYTLSSFEYSDTPLKKVIVYIKNIERISEFSSNIVESFQKYFFPYPNNVTSQDIIAFSPLPYQE